MQRVIETLKKNWSAANIGETQIFHLPYFKPHAIVLGRKRPEGHYVVIANKAGKPVLYFTEHIPEDLVFTSRGAIASGADAVKAINHLTLFKAGYSN